MESGGVSSVFPKTLGDMFSLTGELDTRFEAAGCA